MSNQIRRTKYNRQSIKLVNRSTSNKEGNSQLKTIKFLFDISDHKIINDSIKKCTYLTLNF